ADQHEQQPGDGQGRDQSDDQRDRPRAMVGESGGRDHFPTATLRSARAEWRILTPESLIRGIPPSSVVCARTFSTPSTAARACMAIRLASITIVITIAAATSVTTTPSTSPMTQPVEAPIKIKSHLLCCFSPRLPWRTSGSSPTFLRRYFAAQSIARQPRETVLLGPSFLVPCQDRAVVLVGVDVAGDRARDRHVDHLVGVATEELPHALVAVERFKVFERAAGERERVAAPVLIGAGRVGTVVAA